MEATLLTSKSQVVTCEVGSWDRLQGVSINHPWHRGALAWSFQTHSNRGPSDIGPKTLHHPNQKRLSEEGALSGPPKTSLIRPGAFGFSLFGGGKVTLFVVVQKKKQHARPVFCPCNI